MTEEDFRELLIKIEDNLNDFCYNGDCGEDEKFTDDQEIFLDDFYHHCISFLNKYHDAIELSHQKENHID